MIKFIKNYLVLVACTPLLAACVTATDSQGLKNVNAISSEETYVAFEVPKGKERSLLPSFCAAKKDGEYKFPTSTTQFPSCFYGDNIISDLLTGGALSSLADSFNISILGRAGSAWFKRSAVESKNPDFGTFYFVKVRGLKHRHFFPAFFLSRTRLVPLTGEVPVYDIHKGKINYIGRWPGDGKQLTSWAPEGLREAMAESGIKLPQSSLVIRTPKKGNVTCTGKSLFSNKESRALGRRRCSISVGDGAFF